MKQKFLVTVIFLLIISLAATGCKKEGDDTTTTGDTEATVDGADLEAKASYIIGRDLGSRFKSQGLDISLDDFIAGINDGTDNKDSRYTEEEVNTIMMEFQTYMMEKQKKIAEEKQQEGIEFLEKNKKKKGVVTLDSGLQYKVITEGAGEKPGLQSTVKTHYKGTLLDGTEFDSSYKRNEPAVFPVSGVIPGWTEALQLMPVGSKWELYIPSELAYGPRGSGSSIPPNSVLIFEIELLEIQAQQPQK